MRALREAAGLSLEGLSEAMDRAGRPILPSGLSKIEQGDRRVDVDDLAALAVALGVNPSRLLLSDEAEGEQIALTDAVTVPGWAAWQWADGYMPLPTRPADAEDDPYNTPGDVDDFQRLARPTAIRRTEQHPAMRAATDLHFRVRRVVHHTTMGSDHPATLSLARRALDRLASVLDDVEEDSRG